jgi:hypothetical protein
VVCGPWYPREPFWSSLPPQEAAERLLEWNHRAARSEYDDGLSRGFAEASAYSAMTVGDASVWCLIPLDELARLKHEAGIIAMHYVRVEWCAETLERRERYTPARDIRDELRAMRDAWREEFRSMR